MKIHFFKAACVFLLVQPLSSVKIWAQSYPDQLESFAIKKSPNRRDWQAFMKAGAKIRKELWQYHSNRQKTLKNWAWEWRIAWLKSCAIDSSPYCSNIFFEGLQDDAAVVRAEAATLLGRRFADSQNSKAIAALAGNYRHKLNNTKGKPNFVKLRILEALKRIGGKQAQTTGSKISQLHPSTRDYWQKINRF